MVNPWKRPMIAVAALAAASAGLVAVGTAEAEPAGCAADCVAADRLLEVSLAELHPTQPSVGYDQIGYKLGRYASGKDEDAGDVNKRFDDWCETDGRESATHVDADSRLDDPDSFECAVDEGDETDASKAEMKTVVIGPGDTLYLTDGHHTLTSFWEAADGGPDTTIRVRVEADLSDLSTDDFWDRMRDNDWVWLRDADDQPVEVGDLPDRLGLSEFGDDRYRALVYFTRDIGYGDVDQPAEYLEFYWASWLRDNYDLDSLDRCDAAGYLDLIDDASHAMVSLDDDTIVADGKTAAELGKMDEWNDGKAADSGEFGDLSKPMSARHPGKLAFALDHFCAT